MIELKDMSQARRVVTQMEGRIAELTFQRDLLVRALKWLEENENTSGVTLKVYEAAWKKARAALAAVKEES